MADNVAITAGTGTTIAADDISGVLHQRVKIEYGVDGSATDVSTTNPLPTQGAAADNATAVGNPVRIGGVYNSSTQTYTTGEIADLQSDVNGNTKTTLATGITALVDTIAAKISTDAIMNGNTELLPKFVCISGATSGNNTILAAVTGKKIRVLAIAISFSGAANAKFQSGATGTDISKLFYGVASTQVVLPFNPCGWFETASATLLNMNLSAAVAVDITGTYVEV